MTNTQHTVPNEGHSLPMMEKEIGGTTFRVSASYSPTARETAHEKVLRLILENRNKNDKKSSK